MILDPFPYQQAAIKYLLKRPQFALIADCGLGKTCIFINLFNRLKEEGKAKRMLVFCPRSVMKTAWLEDVAKFSNLSIDIIWHKNYQKRLDILKNSQADICVVNYNVANKMKFDLIDKKFDMIVLDESTFIKNPTAKTTKAVLLIGKQIHYRYIATATPGHKEERYWSQYIFIDPDIWDRKNFYKFREKYFYEIDLGDGLKKYVFNQSYTDEIRKRIRDNSYFLKKEQCAKHLPDRVFLKRMIDMPPTVMKSYKQMKKDYVWDDVVAFFSPSQRQKLRQMANGYVIEDERGREKKIHVLHKEKLKELKYILEDVIPEDEQVLIWSQFVEEAEVISREIGCEKITGLSKDPITIIDKFKSGEIKRVVCHPQSVSHGITWIKCHYCIYFGLTEDTELLSQGMDRIHRVGQMNTCFYYFLLSSGTIDESIFNSHVKNKNKELFLIRKNDTSVLYKTGII